jgi:hypothetical protein
VCHLLNRLTQLITGLLLIAGLAGGVATASAQAPASPTAEERSGAPYWQANFDEQVAQELQQNPSMRMSFLQVVVRQATAHEDLRLSQTADVLLDIIERDANRDHRLMALQALSAIGPEHVGEQRYEKLMGRLYTLAEQDSSSQIRKAAAGVINCHQAG